MDRQQAKLIGQKIERVLKTCSEEIQGMSLTLEDIEEFEEICEVRYSGEILDTWLARIEALKTLFEVQDQEAVNNKTSFLYLRGGFGKNSK